MRSLVKDTHKRFGSVTTLLHITAAMAAGNGVFSDGTPWNMVRTSTGTYEFYFDHRLIPLSGSIGLDQNARIMANFGAMTPGKVIVNFLLHDGTAVNAAFDLHLNWLDTRS